MSSLIGPLWLFDGFKALFSGDTKEGLATLKNSMKGLGDEMQREARLAWEIKEGMIALGKQETDFTLIQAKRKRQIQELIFLTREETRSFKERREALLQANELEQASLNDSLVLQKEKIRLMEQDFERAESMEEDRAALVAERVKLEDMEAASLSRQRELKNRINEMDNKTRADQKARSDARKKEIEKEQKAREEANKQRIADEKAMMDELERMEKEEQEEIEKGLIEIAKMRKQGQEDKLFDLGFYIELEKIKIDEAFADRLINEEERQEMLFQLEVERLQKQMELIKSYYGEESKEAKKAMIGLNAFMTSARAKDTADAIKSEDDKTGAFLKGANASVGAAKWLSGNISHLAKEGSKESKSLAIFEAELAAVQASLQAFAAGSKYSPIVGGIWAALAFTFGQLKIAKMKSVKKAERGLVIDSLRDAFSYASGGLLRGKRHHDGGIPGIISSTGQPIEMEDGEIILNRNVSRDPAGLAMASDLNARYGGIRFMESGGPVNPLRVPSSIPVAALPLGNEISNSNAFEILANKFDNYANKVDAWRQTIKVINVVSETEEGINVINRLEADAAF